ncbi:MAG: glutamine-hydrolyzing carbamoyl-phosphate synthase small subunit [Limnochordales bacterium]|nr:glutamine-hydrolyzing carbamoyl-phosphate synthase small subunit [Limnochordales bacterium]
MFTDERRSALLVLETGMVLQGWAVGAEAENAGEIVFSTGMTGYQEILTDPSYAGQIITFTYPLIGNCGINRDDSESRRSFALGLVVREAATAPSHWRSEQTLDSFLRSQGVPGIEGVDTRALVRHLREFGTCRAVISTLPGRTAGELLAMARQAPTISDTDWVARVTGESVQTYEPVAAPTGDSADNSRPEAAARIPPHIVLYDLGAKYSQIRMLQQRGCRVTVVPARASADEILSFHPDGVLISNGPGDPQAIPYAVETVRGIIKERPELPIFGICLGHQVLALAFGARTYKLKYGHRGANHPVVELSTGRAYMTSQNHGFAVDESSLPSDIVVTHRELNDGTVEGLRHKTRPIFSIQYHPEAMPGPQDAAYFFDRFLELVRGGQAGGNAAGAAAWAANSEVV